MSFRPFDKLLELRNFADRAETSTASEAGVALDVRKIAEFKAVVFVTALDTADTDETYSLTIETDSVAAFNDTPVVLATLVVTATGVFEIPLSGPLVEQLDPDAAAIRVTATLGGTTPSITYGAYLTSVA